MFPNLVHISGNKKTVGNSIFATSNAKTHIHKPVPNKKTKHKNAFA
jgi:hypothetical protein